ncbi:MAG TPA: serine hydrolase [Chitinophagaceae bacterium]|nr:serine hydrolase [Chitinophagaceae bacterium]
MKISRNLIAVLVLLATQFNLNAQGWPLKEWLTATPQSQSMNVDSLKAFDKDITSGKYGYVDGMVITRHGRLVYQKTYTHDYDKIYGDNASKPGGLNQLDPGGQYNYYNPWWHPFYRRGELHSLQSVTKTITSVLIGVATARKEFPDLSTTVLSFFDTTQVKNIDDRKRKLTIRHLLTMTAGFDWNENLSYSDPRNDCTQMEASFDWIRFVIDKPMADEPGEAFNYNSGASQLLSYIFRKATGKDIEEYASLYLFSPLGINQYFWKRTPTGLADTEGGLYLAATDLAKIYYMYLRDGNWNGKQLVTSEWVKASVTPAITVSRTVKYGYKWWLYEYDNDIQKYAWAGSGFGGQWPIIIPEYDIVAVFTGWNITGGNPSLRVNEAISRLVNAVSDKK